MNTKSLLLSLGLLFSLASCERVYDEPLLGEAPQSTLTPNITISDLKAKYAGATQNKPLIVDADYVLKAIVSGNDESGNIYKTLWIMDETGGMPVAVDMNEMSSEYMVGQELFIKLKGLAINVYGGVQQIGYVEEGSTNTRIPQALFSAIVEKSGYPDINKVVPVVTTIGQLDNSMIGKVVEFNDVAWREPGQVFAVKEENTNRNITDGTKSLIVRNSGYSTFAGDKLPEGIGTVRGVLSKVNSDFQLFLRTKDDVLNFRPGQPAGGPVTPAPTPGAGSEGGSTEGPAEQGANAILLFPGSDFESQPDFGSFGLKDAAIEKGVGRDGSSALHISGTPGGNNYVFSTPTTNAKAGQAYTKISFWVKGTVSGKSLSVNVYDKDGKYWGFNLGDVTGNVTITNSGTTADGGFVNDYNGSINTGGKWVLITLDITGLALNTSGSGNVFALKDGKEVPYDLYIDDIKIE